MEGAEVANPPPVMGTPAWEVEAAFVGVAVLEKLQACKAINNTEASESFKIVFSMFLISINNHNYHGK